VPDHALLGAGRSSPARPPMAVRSIGAAWIRAMGFSLCPSGSHQVSKLESASRADTFAGTVGVMGSQRLTFFPMEPPNRPHRGADRKVPSPSALGWRTRPTPYWPRPRPTTRRSLSGLRTDPHGRRIPSHPSATRSSGPCLPVARVPRAVRCASRPKQGPRRPGSRPLSRSSRARSYSG